MRGGCSVKSCLVHMTTTYHVGYAIMARIVQTVEMHTGGEPLRIIVSGYPQVIGGTILEKLSYVRSNLDHLRSMLMCEPRGHTDMYGALLVEKDIEEADMAVIFTHSEGYSTMCGHSVIALGRYAIDYNVVKPVNPETPIKIQCPCGLVTAQVEYDAQTGKTGQVRFESVPAFAFTVDQTIQVDGYGEIKYDIGYGGAFFALVDAHQLNMNINHTPIHLLAQAADAISTKLKKSVQLHHPETAELAYLFGTILTDGKDAYPDDGEVPTANLNIFGNKQVDRSPTGSGVTTRIAVQFHKKQIRLGQSRMFINSKTNSRMTGKPLRVVTYGCYDDAVVVEVSGSGHYTGECSFWVEEGDRLGAGFLVK